MEEEVPEQEKKIEVEEIIEAITQEQASTMDPMQEERPEQGRPEVEETVSAIAEAIIQEPASSVEPMEEERPKQERLEIEETVLSTTEAVTQEPTSTVEPVEQGIMGTMEGIDMVIQESTFINDVPEETVPAPSTQKVSDKGGGATQEPPPTHSVPESMKGINPEVETEPQEPVSTKG